MPLRETEDSTDSVTLQDVKEPFLIFYSSRDESGKLWCPDCVAVENLVQEVFGPEGGPSGLIVYVGQRSEWKTPNNPFRGAPWNVNAIPTVIRIRDGARLVETEIARELASFVKSV
ncbi:hypothetical protein OBBRIDRAFT_813135 [Obba rivulosa]|uniref:Thioredoxin domain-containing protein n=1 Tax=Obba rivulosa TaxID=1052685 RepID=A0A8E2AZQ2_9APHY|nr:hypothetical protein OBBRIDRAFT_813135 [Obba rivulosa]